MTLTRWRNSLLWMGLAALLAAGPVPVVDIVSPSFEVRSEPTSRRPLTGPKLHQQLGSLVPGATWKNAPLRTVLRQVSDGYAVAVVCDRRVDPTRAPDVEAANVPLREVLQEVAADVGAELRVVGNVAYIAPSDAASAVRTLVELRKQELVSEPGSAGVRPATVAWGDLATSAEVLQAVADRFRVKVENPEAVPHDLWAAATLPEMTAPEMLTLVLIQFGLTFAWGDEFRSIRITPLPADVGQIVIERFHSAVRRPSDTVALLKERLGPIDAEVVGQRVVVRGPVELHEAIDEVLAGRPSARSPQGSAAPLNRRRFTLSVKAVPARAVMDKLAESGVRFDYDAAALSAADVDLNAPVTLDVKQASAQDFFEALFSPIGVVADIRGLTVRLRPARR
jgi:hypothetical protein